MTSIRCSTHFKLFNVEGTIHTGKHHEAMQKSEIVHEISMPFRKINPALLPNVIS